MMRCHRADSSRVLPLEFDLSACASPGVTLTLRPGEETEPVGRITLPTAAYCRGLERVLARYSADRTPTCVVGDFNQRIPRVGQPVNVAKALADAIPADFIIATEGLKGCGGD
jgi:hypothetical protein